MQEYRTCLREYFLGELSKDFLELLKGYEELEIVEGCVFEGWREDSEMHLTEDDPGARSQTFFCQDSWD